MQFESLWYHIQFYLVIGPLINFVLEKDKSNEKLTFLEHLTAEFTWRHIPLK